MTLTTVQKHWYFLALGLFFIVIVVVILSSFSSKPPQEQQLTFPPTPTPVPLEHVIINQSSLDANTEGVNVINPLEIQFSASLSASQQNQVQVTISPDTAVQKVWNGNTLQIVPQTSFLDNTNYTLSLFYAGQTKTYDFTSGSTSNLSNSDLGVLQGRLDDQYSQHVQQQQNNYPWLATMPLQATGYFVYFDTTQKAFIAQLYPTTTSATSVDDQVTALKKEVTAAIQTLGNNASSFPVQWTITPGSE